ncbi:hypothetical protein CDC46_00890 [Ralstonia solanacearum]|uniref:DUF6279 family lipoprotein n=1 Tax=Ralstonia solanacearum TaxID=305 RepID=UPI001B3B3546|nr:DUF6279 family lipoprotein [Ralstonia solanacearum]AST30873.2 hypothetical protein CDC46_00890 [Ralstonia solanacearum]MDB0510602.1 DUF6279 family lipoprotein [Ralstonia solanacearum]MDB0515588.1 DUF6279 family lipoprotein [Ralstonia solanacearum]
MRPTLLQHRPNGGRVAPVAWSARLARWLVLAALAGLAACSTLKLGYQQGDHLVYWWVDRYFDIQDAQADAARGAIARFFAWHRREQLPRIAELLERAKGELQQPVTAEQIRYYQNAYYALGRAAFERARPDIADLLLTVTPEQIGHVRQRFDAVNETYRQRYLQRDGDDRSRERFKHVMDNARLVYGRFSAEQEDAIRPAVAPLVAAAPARYDERLLRQQAWLALLERVRAEHPDKPTVMQWLTAYADQWEHPPGERGARRNAYLDASVDVSMTIANLTTPQQKLHARDRLQGWIDDAHDLMRSGAPTAVDDSRPDETTTGITPPNH